VAVYAARKKSQSTSTHIIGEHTKKERKKKKKKRIDKQLTNLQYNPHALQFNSSFSPLLHNGVCVAPQLLHSAFTPPGALLFPFPLPPAPLGLPTLPFGIVDAGGFMRVVELVVEVLDVRRERLGLEVRPLEVMVADAEAEAEAEADEAGLT
jgi:hypothetical protein